MGRSKRKRPSNTNVEPKPKKARSDDGDEETTSESDSGSDETGNNKHRRNQRTESAKGDTNNKNGSIQSGEDDESESDDEAPLVKLKKRSKKDKMLEVEAIISNKQLKGKTKYLLKWKDGSETWETKKKTTKVCPGILSQYIEETKKAFDKAFEVEAIVSHRKKNSRIKYLIKWKDHSKGETWETEFRTKQLCPELVTLYVQEMEIANQKAIEVGAIVGHKMEHQKHKYLIKWKDHSKGETWETVRKTISLCPDILDEFIKDRPEAVPPSDYFNPSCWWYKETKDKPKRNKNLFGRKKLSDEDDDEESDENTEWEVAHIVKHRIKRQNDWEFLIRWKGCTAKDDTWEVEENLNCPDLLLKYLAEVPDSMRKDSRPVKKQSLRIGYGQIYAIAITTSYYASVLTLIIKYFIASFGDVLPWSYCRPEWGPDCIDSAKKSYLPNETLQIHNGTSSAELYFYKEVLKELPTIDNGIGKPDLTLVAYLVLTWSCVSLILIKGIKSSGKASYFLAIFPYVIMLILFVRAVTLPGAIQGISYLFTPQFNQLLNPKVWYSAMTQVFFSLSICFGPIIMYASFNRFSQNMLRDVTIVTILDTFTSLLSSVIIFGILGNLAHETGSTDIQSVVQGGSGLAFVSYPNAIAKFKFIPQVFSVLFFFMLFVLGVGTNVGMSSCILNVIRDSFPKHRHWKFVLPVALVQFSIGLIYLTPGGQYIMTFMDFFGASFVVICLAIAEILSFGWIYGVSRLCKDIEFMLGIKTGWYWRICWGVISPLTMTAILCFKAVTLTPLKYHDYVYTESFYCIGWLVFAVGVIQLPIWAAYSIYKQQDLTIRGKIISAFRPQPNWGPSDLKLKDQYKEFLIENSSDDFDYSPSIWKKFMDNLFG